MNDRGTLLMGISIESNTEKRGNDFRKKIQKLRPTVDRCEDWSFSNSVQVKWRPLLSKFILCRIWKSWEPDMTTLSSQLLLSSIRIQNMYPWMNFFKPEFEKEFWIVILIRHEAHSTRLAYFAYPYPFIHTPSHTTARNFYILRFEDAEFSKQFKFEWIKNVSNFGNQIFWLCGHTYINKQMKIKFLFN